MVTVKKYDFIELNYTGKLDDGIVFDTTLPKVAKDHILPIAGLQFKAQVICIGENQILPGLDEELIGKEVGKEYSITLPPEKAFGKRDIKRIKIVPTSTFKEHKVQPQPGLQIDVDGECGTVTKVSGGRIIVNFNHPLAGKTVNYNLKIERKVTDPVEKIKAFLTAILRVPVDKIEVKVEGEKAEVSLPIEFPVQVSQLLAKKLVEVTQVKDILFKKQ